MSHYLLFQSFLPLLFQKAGQQLPDYDDNIKVSRMNIVACLPKPIVSFHYIPTQGAVHKQTLLCNT